MVTAASRRRAPAAVSRGGWGEGMGTCSGPMGGARPSLRPDKLRLPTGALVSPGFTPGPAPAFVQAACPLR